MSNAAMKEEREREKKMCASSHFFPSLVQVQIDEVMHRERERDGQDRFCLYMRAST